MWTVEAAVPTTTTVTIQQTMTQICYEMISSHCRCTDWFIRNGSKQNSKLKDQYQSQWLIDIDFSKSNVRVASNIKQSTVDLTNTKALCKISPFFIHYSNHSDIYSRRINSSDLSSIRTIISCIKRNGFVDIFSTCAGWPIT